MKKEQVEDNEFNFDEELELYRQQLMDDEDIAFMAGLNVDIIPPRDDKHDETI